MLNRKISILFLFITTITTAMEEREKTQYWIEEKEQDRLEKFVPAEYAQKSLKQLAAEAIGTENLSQAFQSFKGTTIQVPDELWELALIASKQENFENLSALIEYLPIDEHSRSYIEQMAIGFLDNKKLHKKVTMYSDEEGYKLKRIAVYVWPSSLISSLEDQWEQYLAKNPSLRQKKTFNFECYNESNTQLHDDTDYDITDHFLTMFSFISHNQSNKSSQELSKMLINGETNKAIERYISNRDKFIIIETLLRYGIVPDNAVELAADKLGKIIIHDEEMIKIFRGLNRDLYYGPLMPHAENLHFQKAVVELLEQSLEK